mmetsp:Transcript_100703/g.291078  ORF Transcript_100703/g.291078 Transcript_100703/m.291078 type:complete len:407 (-) Transcript_100703:47-1267(-)
MAKASRAAMLSVARRLPTIASHGGRCMLTAMADFAGMPLEKRSVRDLLQMAECSPEERAMKLHETLKVGLARCAMRLSEMPFGFCNAPSIKRVTSAYVQDFQQVIDYEYRAGRAGVVHKDYHDITRAIFNQHRGTMLDVAKGVFEFNEDLHSLFGKELDLSEVRGDLKVIQDIEASLDAFFTERLTLRLLISHVHNLNKEQSADHQDGQEMVGVVNVNTEPITILSRAYVAARFMCMRDFQLAPNLEVNGVTHDEYILSEASRHQHFPYVHTHLFYVFLEILKNAARASIERAQLESGDGRPPKIPSLRVIVPEEQSLWNRERSIKLADRGTGMSRHVLSKAFCYFFSSVKARPTVAEEVGDFDRRVPLAGFGFGLPISRVMARYFEGDIDLNSIRGKGTDVYVYL